MQGPCPESVLGERRCACWRYEWPKTGTRGPVLYSGSGGTGNWSLVLDVMRLHAIMKLYEGLAHQGDVRGMERRRAMAFL